MGTHWSSLRNVMAGPVVATAALGPGSVVLHAPPRRAIAFVPTLLPSTAHDQQHNGKRYQSSSTTCPAVSAFFGLTPAVSLPRLQHRMKRRRRLERVEQALQTTNRKTDHEFIQNFLVMLEILQTPEL